MSRNIWFCSDTHFGHANIIKYSHRPFASVEEHDAILIENWNNLVMERDEIFFLGDLMYRNKAATESLRKRLNGQIYFIQGNHDASAFAIRNTFAWYKDVYEAKLPYAPLGSVRITMSHYAHRVWNKSHHGAWHLYGHSHASLPDDKNSLSFDVGVDNTAMRLSGSPLYGTGQIDTTPGLLQQQDYRPINLDEVAAVMKTKSFAPIDHHGRDRRTQTIEGEE